MNKTLSSKPVQIALIGVAAVAALALIVWLALRIKNMLSSEMKNLQLIADANAEIDTSGLTLTTAQFNTLVSKLYTAMKGWGTDEAAVYEAFQTLGSRSDLLQLIRLFGVKDEKTLPEWIYSDLTQREIDKLNSILASKQINYIF